MHTALAHCSTAANWADEPCILQSASSETARLRQLVAAQHQELQQLQDALQASQQQQQPPDRPPAKPRSAGFPQAASGWGLPLPLQHHVSPLAPVPKDLFL